ncbi:cell wall metabolism sensor histidine kinase WalK [Streptomyces sp. BK340]|uniref:sensor histidine kinase n=1 Tax=Streptomyces sp. BK340 TaxID=2572903 RepID=UPI0011A1D911|nr:HAMP domain-containing sensor histidine kinase [Streptomyces sp. BK340]TVZ81789.1 two-component system sensor histidine kinase MprB [Streptomyces sp. BK340]
MDSTRQRLAILHPRRSLGTVFALSFACVTAATTLLGGFVSYSVAARMVRVDQDDVFRGVVGDLHQQVVQQPLSPPDYFSVSPDRDSPRDDLSRRIRTDVQVLGAAGRVEEHGYPALKVRAADRAAASHSRAGHTVYYRTEIEGDRYRVATVALGGGRGAVQVAQQYSDTEDLLRELKERTVELSAVVIVVAGLAGWWLARRIAGRLVRLTRVAEDVARTGRLDTEVPVAGQDEVGRLGRAFDGMLGRLAASEEIQRRLVQDAGHELRTPLTSLQANAALLDRIDRLPPQAKADLIADMKSETRELVNLVNELVELAAGDRDAEQLTEVTLGAVAEDAAALARRRTGREIVVDADDTVVRVRPSAVQRALSNLLENAAKFDRDGSEPIEVVIRGTRVEVRDRGPGLADADLPRVFDRFYRADSARSLPGSGLGLAIVHAVALTHGGTAFARNRPGGGAVIGFTTAPPAFGEHPRTAPTAHSATTCR